MAWARNILGCYNGTCDFRQRYLGDKCLHGKQCEAQTKCIGGVCQYLSVGEWCWYGISNCDPETAYCSMALERKCAPKLRVGMTGCDDAQQNDNACERGAHCVNDKCVALRREGESCDGTDATTCYSDYYGFTGPRMVLGCVDGRCQSLYAQRGELCSSGKSCDPIKGLVCNGGQCIEMSSVSEGGPCSTSVACADGSLCMDGRCSMLPNCTTNDECPIGSLCVSPASSTDACRGRCVSTLCSRESKVLQDCLLARCGVPDYNNEARSMSYRWDPLNCPNTKCRDQLRAQSLCLTARIQKADSKYREGKQPWYN